MALESNGSLDLTFEQGATIRDFLAGSGTVTINGDIMLTGYYPDGYYPDLKGAFTVDGGNITFNDNVTHKQNSDADASDVLVLVLPEIDSNSTTTFKKTYDAKRASIYIGFDPMLDFYSEAELTKGTATVVLDSGAALKAAQVKVEEKGHLVLTGNASITAATTFGNASVLDPGLNTLAITGDATFEAGSEYVATLGNGANSLVAVTGSATIIDGARITVQGVDPGSSSPTTILMSSGATSGVFTNPIYNIANSGTAVVVSGVKNAETVAAEALGSGGGTRNTESAGRFYTTVMQDRSSSSSALRTQMAEALQAAVASANPGVAFSQLFGENNLQAMAVVHDVAKSFFSGIGEHQVQIRNNRNAMAPASVRYPDSLASLNDSWSRIDPNRVWLAGFGVFTRQANDGAKSGYKFNSGGFILGYDRECGDFDFGFTGAYSSGRVKTNDGYTRTNVETANLALYASYNPGRTGLFVDVNAGLGRVWSKKTTTRVIGGVTRGKYHNNSVQAGLAVGYDFTLPREFHLIPSVGLQYTHVRQNRWTESYIAGSGVSNWFPKASDNFVEIPVGLKFNRTFAVNAGTIIVPEIRGAWIYSATDPLATSNYGYVGSDLISSVPLRGINTGRNRGLIGGGLKAKFNNRADVFVDYNFEFRRKYRNHGVQAGLGFSF
jgi:uncharacterized protein with beta-barrel porin domain